MILISIHINHIYSFVFLSDHLIIHYRGNAISHTHQQISKDFSVSIFLHVVYDFLMVTLMGVTTFRLNFAFRPGWDGWRCML
jgi:hypothetical protein